MTEISGEASRHASSACGEPADAIPSKAAETFGSGMDSILRDAVFSSPPTVIAPGDCDTFHLIAAHPAVTIDLPADAESVPDRISELEGEQRCVLLYRLLQHDVDYRLILGTAFEKLCLGGFLLVVVPSQILYERKYQLPSRLPSRFGKFYMPSTLLGELEEAIDPFSYRLRFAGDVDDNYVDAGFDQPPGGRSDVLVVIEKIASPPWLDRLLIEDRPVRQSLIPTEHPRPAAHPPYIVVSPEPDPLQEILILQLDHRGDFLMGFEARKLIRETWPAAHITLVCGSWNQQDALEAGLVDTALAFDFYAEDVSAGAPSLSFDQHSDRLVRLVENRTFDLAVDLRVGADTRPFLQRISARKTAGIDSGDAFPWLDIRLPIINAERASRTWQRFVPACELFTLGEHAYLDMKISPEDCERANDKIIVWGPYMDLPIGDYELILKCSSATRTEIRYDISADGGVTILTGGAMTIGPLCEQMTQFHLSQAAERFEFRVFAIPGRPYPPLAFGGFKISKLASSVGLHQRENMKLLAYLITLRLEQAAVAEEIARHVAG